MDTRPREENSAPRSAPIRPTEGDARAQVQSSPGQFAEEYPAYCRLLQDLPNIPRYNVGKGRLSHMPAGNQDSGWQNCLSSVEKYDRELCQAYREQIDTLLVFAGLFSAVVTAFAVESYQWLQDDPVDTSVDLLRDVVGLLSQNLNLTVPPTPAPSQRLSGPAVTRINSFWFLSLSLSLSAALVGILCKQWLREFERNVGQSPEKALSVRYIRFQGFEFWKVGSIVTSVPIIMQVALAFFMIGVVELLWRLNTVVACCVTGTAGLTLLFYLVTTFLPVVQYACICMKCYMKPLQIRDYPELKAFTEPQCAFKSAQAWIAFRVAQPIINRLLKGHGYQFSLGRPPVSFERILRPGNSWVDFDLNWMQCRDDIHAGPRCAFECMAWIAGNLGEMHMSSWIWHCVWSRWIKTRDHYGSLKFATSEIASVARSYPSVAPLDHHNNLLVRSQALLFQCSLRADLPINTALEILIRVADALGASADWMQEALNQVRTVYLGLSIRLSDDIAKGLFRLAELQTHAILFEPDGPTSANKANSALGFGDITIFLQTGTRLHPIFMPAMCGLVLQWMRSEPHIVVSRTALSIFEDMVMYLVSQGYRGVALRKLSQCHGIIFYAKLAGAVAEKWSVFSRDVFEHNTDARGVLLELLAIFSRGFDEPSPDQENGGMEPYDGVVGSADEGQSGPPVPEIHLNTHAGDEAQPEPLGPLDQPIEESQPPLREHVRSNVHVEAGLVEAEMEVARNSPASPVVSAVVPASPLRSSGETPL